MTTTSPWAPQNPQGQADRPLPAPPPAGPPPQPPVAPVAPPPVSRPGRRPGLLVVVLGMAVLMVFAVAATAAITYAISRGGNEQAAQPSQPTATNASSTPQFTAAERDAAKAKLCGVFDKSTRGQQGQGALVQNGQVNVPLVLRSVNSAFGVQTALTPAVPSNVADAARSYVNSSIELTTAAMGNVSIDEGNRLNDANNAATYSLADACGLPH